MQRFVSVWLRLWSKERLSFTPWLQPGDQGVKVTGNRFNGINILEDSTAIKRAHFELIAQPAAERR